MDSAQVVYCLKTFFIGFRDDDQTFDGAGVRQDFIADIPDFDDKHEADAEDVVPQVEAHAQIVVKNDRKTLYNYFNARLQKFDPETYNTSHPDYKYPKKCEQKHQPIILNTTDLRRISRTPYDISELSDDQKIDIERV